MSAQRPTGPVFGFEDLGQDLPRPPLAAIRFFRKSGVKLALRSWQQLPVDVRWGIASEGSRDTLDPNIVKSLMRSIPLREIELVDERSTPEGEPSAGLAEALGQATDFAKTWASLGPFQRFVLNVLRNNKRLLYRAYTEMMGLRSLREEWRGLVASAELMLSVAGEVRSDLLRLLATERLLDGRGLLLARASGRRAARLAGELFDLYSESMTGAVEVDWAVRVPTASVLWQAHVSTHGGDFFPAASLAAVSTAAVCLLDMVKEFDPGAFLRETRLMESEWMVGRLEVEVATAVYGNR